MITSLKTPFSEAQLELLKLFNTSLNDSDLLELKQILLDFKFRKLQQVINQDVEKKGYSEHDFEQMSQEHNRTPYQTNHKKLSQNN
jgi:hypothetical protein